MKIFLFGALVLVLSSCTSKVIVHPDMIEAAELFCSEYGGLYEIRIDNYQDNFVIACKDRVFSKPVLINDVPFRFEIEE